MSLLVHDFDGDGDPDLLFSDRKGARAGLFWLENPGAAANRARQPWREHALGAIGREVMFADLADLDGDGRPEVLAAVKPRDIVILHPEAGGRWREETLALPAEGIGDAKAVRAADLNGDGRVDLVFSCEHARDEREGVVWLERRADGGWWQRSLAGAPGVKFDLLQLLDLDGDGDLDVLTCEEASGLGVIWYENPARRRP
ncbi:MAG: VCBS repeat-containing protein [Verrucomicrobia bacterium]|nr:VCBS repeat-containing protein [Verrucomicrobiota bacterium]